MENVKVIADNLDIAYIELLKELGIDFEEVNNGNGSGTFRDAFVSAISENDDDTIIYLLEDDFLHKEGSADLIEEGLENLDCYVTLYDHPDKYLNREEGGNPFIEDGGEVTRVIKTDSIHWKITNSTVMSFAARVSRLKEDKELLLKYSSNNITDSFGFFTELSETKGIPVISSLPGFSTHCEKAWLSPLTKWENIE